MKNLFTFSLFLTSFLLLSCQMQKDDPAVSFLNSLSPEQRSMAQLSFEDSTKTIWHYVPGSMFPRPGIEMTELNTSQRELANSLLQSYLSETGYEKTQQIIDLENVLAELSGDTVMRNPDKYSIAFFGDPENDHLWAWSFEGHHISLNFTVLDGKASTAPRFMGANPARILSGSREGERTLDREEDLGFDLIRAMTDEQQAVAIFQEDSLSGMVTRNFPIVDPLKSVGIRFDVLDDNQQVLFLTLLDEYLSTLPVEQAQQRMKQIMSEEADALTFGWAGALMLGEGHYYRIQGNSFLIEFDNTQDNSNHIHSVWRDFDGDFGRDLIQEHYQTADHHQK